MSITIELSNLGPLRSASLELANLTILMGDNNTGKTFLATVVHRTLRARRLSSWTASRRATQPPDEVQEWIYDVVRELDGSKPLREPSDALLAWADELVNGFLQDFGSSVKNSIEYAFGTQASNLRRKTPSRHAVDCYLRIYNTEPYWQIDVRFDSDNIVVEPPDIHDWLTSALDAKQLRESSRSFVIRSLLSLRHIDPPSPVWEYFYEYLEETLFLRWPAPAVHLPSGRTGIMHSYHVLAGNVAQQSAAAGIRPIGVDPLPGTAADFLSIILSRENVPPQIRKHRRFDAIIDDIEKSMRAQIVIDRAEGQPVDSLVAITPEGPFSLWRTSSMISELAPVVLVLKHSIGSNGHLTIDEPESHLHPEMQRRIAASLGHLVNSGVHLLLTTHSDYLVTAFSNMIRTGELRSARQRSGRGLPRLDRSRVRALRFSRERRWCTALPCDIAPLTGIEDTTFTEVMERQYDESSDLIDELLENEDLGAENDAAVVS